MKFHHLFVSKTHGADGVEFISLNDLGILIDSVLNRLSLCLQEQDSNQSFEDSRTPNRLETFGFLVVRCDKLMPYY